MEHQTERLGGLAALEPSQRLIGESVGAVFFLLNGALVPIHLEHDRLMVPALAFDDVPVIESGGLGFQVPLADQSGLITGMLGTFGDMVGLRIQRVAQGFDPVQITVLAGEEGVPAGHAD
jgi:hypothetical protein